METITNSSAQETSTDFQNVVDNQVQSADNDQVVDAEQASKEEAVSDNQFAQWLDIQLKERQMSAEELAKLIQVSRASIYFYLSDTTRPTTQNLVKICQVFGADPIEVAKLYTQRSRGRSKKSAQ